MFIELPNETRVNINHIISYFIRKKDEEKDNTIFIDLIEGGHELIRCSSVEEANQTIIALDRAIGIKPLMIRK